ncbi:MAG: flap endonuclease [Deltaproteobacteria bacterium]|nr:flap endonuclease [Deltaproteobacteria bacterium]
MRLHVVDGTFELYRAHFSKRPEQRAPDGRDVKATLGLLSSLLTLLQDASERVTHLAVAFDNPIVSFRNALFEDYKSDAGVPPELRAQFDLVEEGVRALGVVVWSMDRYEADDALATAARRWRDEVEQVRLLTPDKDLGQCLVDRRVVQVDRVRQREIDVAALEAQRGVRPESLPDYLALVGDSADGIPGIPGFGARTAATLLAEYPHLEQIPERAEDWRVAVRGAERLASTLAARRDDALLYRRLATLVEDVPLRESLADLEWRGASRRALGDFLERTGGAALLDRLHLARD